MKQRKLFHKATLGGLLLLLSGRDESSVLCCSTENSAHLFGRNICVEMVVPETAIVREHTDDIDAHSVTAWDEVRINFDPAFIARIICNKRQKITDADMQILANYGVISANNDDDAKDQIRDLFQKLEITPIRKSGYSKHFLNIK